MSAGYFKSFDGAKIYYDKTVKDKKKWLVFLHGFGGDLTAWDKEREYFTNLGISNLAMDLRGHGLSERSNNKSFYKLENFSKDLVSLIKEENLSDPVVIGHCFGGIVSINFQANNPKSSKGLILVDTSFKPPFFSYNPVERTFLKYLLEMLTEVVPDIKISGHRNFNKFINTGDWDIKRILSDILHTSLKSYLSICQNLVQVNARDLLSKIIVPTLVIEGTADTIFPPDIAKYLSKRIKKSELDLIPGANHILVLNNPKDLEKSIEGFLKKINFI